MLRTKIRNTLRTTISDIIVVLLFLLIIINVVKLFGEAKINEVFSTLNMIVINHEQQKVNISIEEIANKEEIKIDEEKNRLTKYPSIGEKYGQIKIESIGVDLPLYFGDSLDILKNGIGHSTWSYFPGEGGSIVCMGHNYKTMLRNFSKLKLGDIINVKTYYGEYNYKIYDMKIVEETDMSASPIQDENEIFMIYTCYPFNNVGYTTKRYMVYAKLQQ